MIREESETNIDCPATAVFAYVEDFAHAPSWLESCVELATVAGGAVAEGTPLHYRYRQGGHVGEMDGVVTEYERDRRIELSFTDAKFGVVVTLACTPSAGGTRVAHAIAITPKGAMAKLFSPLIRAGNRKQVKNNVARLKQHIEAAAK